MSIFEVIMLFCFGFSWPFSIYKSWKSKQVGSKSLIFLILVIIGYLAGIIHKLLYSRDYVIILYAVNASMVFIDMLLYFRNKRLAALKQA